MYSKKKAEVINFLKNLIDLLNETIQFYLQIGFRLFLELDIFETFKKRIF